MRWLGWCFALDGWTAALAPACPGWCVNETRSMSCLARADRRRKPCRWPKSAAWWQEKATTSERCQWETRAPLVRVPFVPGRVNVCVSLESVWRLEGGRDGAPRARRPQRFDTYRKAKRERVMQSRRRNGEHLQDAERSLTAAGEGVWGWRRVRAGRLAMCSRRGVVVPRASNGALAVFEGC